MNYASAVNILAKAGYRLTNKCEFNGKIYHDFNSKRTVSVSLVIDGTTGSVACAEITRTKWNDKTSRYEPVKEILTGLQELMDKFAPRQTISL